MLVSSTPTAHPSRERGQAMVEFMFIMGMVSIMFVVVMAVMGSSIHQTFGDVQCALKYGQGAYMDTYFEQSYCFRAVYAADGTWQPESSFVLGRPIISNSRLPESSTVVLPPR